jgi:hypothetical protein
LLDIFSRLSSCPAIASRSGEAGGDESLEISIAFGDKKSFNI